MNKKTEKKIKKNVKKTNSVKNIQPKIVTNVLIRGQKDGGNEIRLILRSMGMTIDRGLSFNSVYHHYYLNNKGVVQCILNSEVIGYKNRYSIDSFYDKYKTSYSALKVKYGR